VNYGRNQFIRDLMVRNGDADKAIWISEMAWNAAPEDVEPRYGRATLDQQARWASLAYQRAQEDWPWLGVVNYWYFKRADDVWLSERRPEAYFQMAEPDFTLMPVYEEMAQYTTQPAVMHAGAHYAPHWTVSYGEGWTVADTFATSQSDAQPAEFTFEGKRIEISMFTSETLLEGQACDVEITIDGELLSETDCRSGVTWRGRSGQHEVVIEPADEIIIDVYRVYDRKLADYSGYILIGLIVIGLISLVIVRRAKPEISST